MIRDASPQGVTPENSRHDINNKRLRRMQRAGYSSTGSSVAGQPAVNDLDVTHLNRRALNRQNAQMRIETKTQTKTPQSQTISRDPAEEARTVFVGNVALAVSKKV